MKKILIASAALAACACGQASAAGNTPYTFVPLSTSFVASGPFTVTINGQVHQCTATLVGDTGPDGTPTFQSIRFADDVDGSCKNASAPAYQQWVWNATAPGQAHFLHFRWLAPGKWTCWGNVKFVVADGVATFHSNALSSHGGECDMDAKLSLTNGVGIAAR